MRIQSANSRCGLPGLGWWNLAILTLCSIMVAMFTVVATAQEPFPAPPRVYIDTTWNPPTQGVTWQVNSTSSFQNALNAANPGDTIVLTKTALYSGNFTLPAKANPNNWWIYIESSALANLPPPGTRVGLADAGNMAKITTPNTTSPINLAPGANHYRLVGLEITSNSTRGGNISNNPPSNNFTYCLVCWSPALGLVEPDSITVDRSYLHGSDTQDVGQGIQANGSNFAVVDSYISDIHFTTNDSQAILAYWTPGPLKIVNNYLSATTENVMIGGAGGYNNPYVPSDIEIRRNLFSKPLAWDSCGIHGTVQPGNRLPNGSTCPSNPHNQWVEKNHLEFKSAQRVIVTGNILENTWLSGQTGSSVLFTIRTTQSGNIAVVDDITFQSNILTNVDSGFGTLEQDNDCGAAWGYPNCTNPGESRRIWVDNNLVLLSPNPDTYQHYWVTMDAGNATHPGLTDYIFQHNTALMNDYSNMGGYIFKLSQQYGCSPLQPSPTHNIWILDNAIVRQPTGDCGFQGTTGLNIYMGDPAPVDPRFFGNVMYVAGGDRVQSWPGTSNDATTTPFSYVNPGNGNYQLLVPDWTNTTDGNVSGINWGELQQALSGNTLSIITTSLPAGTLTVPYSATLMATGGTVPYSWTVTAGSLPTSLSLDSTSGIISGTPAVQGLFPFTATVTDSALPPNMVSLGLSITIGGPPQILTTSLPSGVVGRRYGLSGLGGFVMSVSGGIAPYTWSVISGNLPPGLSLSSKGVISGTPSTSGQYPFTLMVSDRETPPATASAPFTIVVQ